MRTQHTFHLWITDIFDHEYNLNVVLNHAATIVLKMSTMTQSPKVILLQLSKSKLFVEVKSNHFLIYFFKLTTQAY